MQMIYLRMAVFAAVSTIVLGGLGQPAITLAGAQAHPGGLAADGCHNDRKNGGRHCHRSSAPSRSPNTSSQRSSSAAGGQAYYPNCAAARAAGAAPIYEGQPGYGRHLDRDGDGKACE